MVNILAYVSKFLKLVIFTLILCLIVLVEGRANQYVTCGSVLKLMNVGYKIRLHSHDVKYGTGSGQQSVTGTELQEDVNSHWLIKSETGKHCNRGQAIKCGDVIRLQHLATLKNLHSHHFSSPLSGNQEVSAYGDEKVVSGKYLSATGRTYGRPINGQTEIVGVMSMSSNHVHWQAMEGLFIHPTDFNPKQQHNMQDHSEL
uniref:MIR domain-containing protein n=1 Tax=Timema monikensis TaxID=170555 RepID=A0A7R9E4M3_9NEOP|nr:unnamed protein product [Timema monikensis]